MDRYRTLYQLWKWERQEQLIKMLECCACVVSGEGHIQQMASVPDRTSACTSRMCVLLLAFRHARDTKAVLLLRLAL
jgi:hypothetical protein